MSFSKNSFLLILLLQPLSAFAQTDFAGTWVMALTPPQGQMMTFDVKASVEKDSLRLTMSTEDGGSHALKAVSFAENKLRFEIPSGHGRIACTLHRDKMGDFSGICAGPMGEGVTTLRRKNK